MPGDHCSLFSREDRGLVRVHFLYESRALCWHVERRTGLFFIFFLRRSTWRDHQRDSIRLFPIVQLSGLLSRGGHCLVVTATAFVILEPSSFVDGVTHVSLTQLASVLCLFDRWQGT